MLAGLLGVTLAGGAIGRFLVERGMHWALILIVAAVGGWLVAQATLSLSADWLLAREKTPETLADGIGYAGAMVVSTIGGVSNAMIALMGWLVGVLTGSIWASGKR